MSSATPAVAPGSGDTPSEVLVAYTEMLRIRLFEEAAHRLFMQNEIEGSIHLYDGQEAVAVGVCLELRPGDMVAATYRGHGVCIARGSSLEGLFGPISMGGMFTVLKVRDGITSFEDPGWYQHPEGTVAGPATLR